MMISEIISTMKTPYTEVAYCINPKSTPIEQATLAKVANQCMSMRGISAAFALGKISENEVKVSARSDGSINVQLLCEKLGGGGHFTMAAAIIKTKDIYEAVSRLEDVLKIYLDDARSDSDEEE
jgi:c-di-AMP phosphodiesterase-like protein